jgi:hypothetical protein
LARTVAPPLCWSQSSRECQWSAASEAPWAVITSGAQGQGDGTVAFRVDLNRDPVARNAALVIAEQRLELAQQPGPCRRCVLACTDTRPRGCKPSSSDRDARGLRVERGDGCTWMTAAPTSGRGSGAVGVTVARTRPGRDPDRWSSQASAFLSHRRRLHRRRPLLRRHHRLLRLRLRSRGQKWNCRAAWRGCQEPVQAFGSRSAAQS